MQSIARMAKRSVSFNSFRRQSSRDLLTTGRSGAARKAFKYAEKRQWDKLRTLLDHVEGEGQQHDVGQEEDEIAAKREGSTKSLDTTVLDELNEEEDPTPSFPKEERRRGQELPRRQRSDDDLLLPSDLVDDQGRTLLHVLVSNRPPLDLVERVHSLRPEMISASDSSARGLLRSPLHSSIVHGAPHDVVRFLLEQCSETALLRDAEGKVPLVLACEEMGRITGAASASSSSMCDNNNLFLADPNSSSSSSSASAAAAGARVFPALVQRAEELIRALALACPPSVLIEDDRGLTALEHAIFAESPKATVRALQHVTIEMMRKMDAVRLMRKMDENANKVTMIRKPATILPSSREVELKLSLMPATA